MNAASQAAFIEAMQTICAEPTLGDVQSWLWSQPICPNSRFLSQVRLLWGFERDAKVPTVRRFLAGRVDYLESIVAERPEKLSLLIPTKQMLDTLNAFETRNG